MSFVNFSPFWISLVVKIDLLKILDLFSLFFLKKIFLPRSLLAVSISFLNILISFPFNEKSISKPFFWLSKAICFSITSAPLAILAIATLLSVEWSEIPTLHLKNKLLPVNSLYWQIIISYFYFFMKLAGKYIYKNTKVNDHSKSNCSDTFLISRRSNFWTRAFWACGPNFFKIQKKIADYICYFYEW